MSTVKYPRNTNKHNYSLWIKSQFLLKLQMQLEKNPKKNEFFGGIPR